MTQGFLVETTLDEEIIADLKSSGWNLEKCQLRSQAFNSEISWGSEKINASEVSRCNCPVPFEQKR